MVQSNLDKKFIISQTENKKSQKKKKEKFENISSANIFNIFNENKKKYFQYLLKNGIQTPDELYDAITIFLNYNIPRYVNTHNIKLGFKSPFDFISDAFFVKVRNLLAIWNRGAGKTKSFASLMTLNMAFKKNMEIVESGSVTKQATRCFNYLQEYLNEPLIKDLVINIKQSPASIEFKNNNMAYLITASMEGYNGPHPVCCVRSDVEVRLYDNSKIAIENINNYDEVVVFNKRENKFKIRKVLKLYSGKKKMIKIKLANGKELICSKEHKIPSENGDLYAGNLKVGDKLYGI